MKTVSTTLFAPAEYWELTPRQRRQLCNGCGTRGFVGWVVPDTLWGLRVTPACDIHDFMYATGGPCVADKEAADRVFLNNLLRLIDAGSRFVILKKLRSIRAYVYYFAVSFGGGPAYWAGKNAPGELGRVGAAA